MDYIKYIRNWIKRPMFQGLEKDRIVLENISNTFDKPVAWTKINKRGDLYDLRLQNNPYEENIIPLYLRPEDYEYRQQIMQS